MGCPTPAGGLAAIANDAPLPQAGAVSVTFPEAYSGYSAAFFTADWWRDRLRQILAGKGIVGFEVTCVEQVAEVTVYGQPQAVWMVHFRFRQGLLTGETLRAALEAALDRPNVDEMAPVTVGLHATYAAHQPEEGPLLPVFQRAGQVWTAIKWSLAAVFLLQVAEVGLGARRVLKRKEA